MRTLRQVVILAVALVGCGASHGTDDAGSPPADAFVPELDAWSDTDAAASVRPDGGSRPAEPPPGAVVCGGGICAIGEECCRLDSRCVPIGDPTCAPPAGSAPDACARASDCGDHEVCEETGDGITGLCAGGVAHCAPERGPEMCGGFGDGVCGCDGRTYADPCAASRAGVSVSLLVPCGVDAHSSSHWGCENDSHCEVVAHSHCDLSIHECVREDPFVGCGTDAQCPDGRECCPITGTCYDPARPASCAVPPDGTLFPCADDIDCARWDGSYWGSAGGRRESFCDGDGCGPAGGCVRIPSSCTGVLAPVCGCDGVSYQNECEAHREGVRVAHERACP